MKWSALFFSSIGITLIALGSRLPFALAQDGNLPDAGTRISAYICEINGAIALSSDSKKIDDHKLTGRGIATCRNDQGFTTDYAVVMQISADTSIKDLMTNSGVKAIVEPFAVNRDPNEMFDNYDNYNTLHPKAAAELTRETQSTAVSRGLASSRTVALHGHKNKLFINLNLMGNADALQSLKIHSFTLTFDDQAPSLD